MSYQRKIPVHTAYPFRLTVNLIQHKWRGCIINILRSGDPMRLNEIHKRLHMANPRVVNLQLKSMIEDGLLIRTVFNEKIIRTEYHLSPVGLSLVPIFDVLAAWGEEHRSELPEKV